LIAYFLTIISAKYCENPTMPSRVIAKNIGDVFLRHTVYLVHTILRLEAFSVQLNVLI